MNDGVRLWRIASLWGQATDAIASLTEEQLAAEGQHICPSVSEKSLEGIKRENILFLLWRRWPRPRLLFSLSLFLSLCLLFSCIAPSLYRMLYVSVYLIL
jgi:hypothetical protein